MEALEISVVFDELYVPAHVWESEWQGHMPDSPILTEETTLLTPLNGEIEAGMEAYIGYDDIAGRTVGFRWEWPPKPGSLS